MSPSAAFSPALALRFEDQSLPLTIDAGGRYLRRGNVPIMLHGDTPWSIATQLTHAQIDTYLDDREAKGFNAVLFNAIDSFFSGNTPKYRNRAGHDPFTTMSPVDFASPNNSYWQTVDYIVNEARDRGIICMIEPAYLGFTGGEQGWHVDVQAESDADLQTYGQWLANRYTQDNIIWCMGGDYVPPNVAKQWNIVVGIRSVRTTDIITAHGERASLEAWPDWNTQAGFNLNNTYVGAVTGNESSTADDAYGRAGPIPFFMIEGLYDSEGAENNSGLVGRRQYYVSVLRGALGGHFFGNNPVWGFGEPFANGGLGPQNALDNHLSTALTLDMAHAKDLFTAYQWWKLEPKTDNSLVSSGLGSGASVIAPARASDGSFAMVWKHDSGNATIVMSAMTPASVRARFFNTQDGTYTTVAGSPFANTGSQVINWPGERVLVLDAA